MNLDASSTWRGQGQFNIGIPSVGSGPNDFAEYGLDTLELGSNGSSNIQSKSQPVGALSTKDVFLGSLGLGLTEAVSSFLDHFREHTSFLQHLKNSYKIPSLSFAYTSGARYRESLHSH